MGAEHGDPDDSSKESAMSLSLALRETLDRQVAAIQSDIGAFLMQKDRIYRMPASDNRDGLLARQGVLETEAMAKIASANELKAKLPGSLSDILKMGVQSPGDFERLGKASIETVNGLVDLKKKMDAHTQNVNAAAGGAVLLGPSAAVSTPTGAVLSPGRILLGLGAIIGLAVAWKKGYLKHD